MMIDLCFYSFFCFMLSKADYHVSLFSWICQAKFNNRAATDYLTDRAMALVDRVFAYFRDGDGGQDSLLGQMSVPGHSASLGQKLIYVLLKVDQHFNSNIVKRDDVSYQRAVLCETLFYFVSTKFDKDVL